MGNDGGTVVRRADIVRVREDDGANVDPAILARVMATTCALTRQSLQVPVVSDDLGRLYNKESVIKLLLQRADGQGKGGSDVLLSAGTHIRGLKDTRELKLTANPTFNPEAKDANEVDGPAPFMCPLQQREMSGRYRFVFLRPCGCVMSESGLRATVKESASSAQKDKTSTEGSKKEKSARSAAMPSNCPVCATPFSTDCLAKKDIMAGGDVVILNGTKTEVETMRVHMEMQREAERLKTKNSKAVKSSSKRSRADADGGEQHTEAKRRLAGDGDSRAVRKADSTLQSKGSDRAAAVASQHSITSVEELVKTKEMSTAMRSIYGLDRPKDQDTWMTRGTFNRFA